MGGARREETRITPHIDNNPLLNPSELIAGRFCPTSQRGRHKDLSVTALSHAG